MNDYYFNNLLTKANNNIEASDITCAYSEFAEQISRSINHYVKQQKNTILTITLPALSQSKSTLTLLTM